MPPDIKTLAPRSGGGNISRGDEALLKMFSSDGAGFAIQSKEWQIEEEFEMLIDTVRDTKHHIRDRLGALKMLNERSKVIAELNGLIVKGKYTAVGRDDQGNSVQVVESSARLLSNLKKGLPGHDDSPFADRAKAPIEQTPVLGDVTGGDGVEAVDPA